MLQHVFALFVDVMGVKRDLVSPAAETNEGFDHCRERLEDFRTDLFVLINQMLPMLLMRSEVPEPRFIAEFSDSAYIVGDRFASVAVPGIYLMRQALRHGYPLRGGVGFGTFSHESSGVRANQNTQVWTTSSFLGSAIVTAYQAERSTTPGLRIFVHPNVIGASKSESYWHNFAIPLPDTEVTTDSNHELRVWLDIEADAAATKLRDFRDRQDLPERPRRHYDATLTAYERFALLKGGLPFLTPALWLY
jgi:hypothetical protein